MIIILCIDFVQKYVENAKCLIPVLTMEAIKPSAKGIPDGATRNAPTGMHPSSCRIHTTLEELYAEFHKVY